MKKFFLIFIVLITSNICAMEGPQSKSLAYSVKISESLENQNFSDLAKLILEIIEKLNSDQQKDIDLASIFFVSLLQAENDLPISHADLEKEIESPHVFEEFADEINEAFDISCAIINLAQTGQINNWDVQADVNYENLVDCLIRYLNFQPLHLLNKLGLVSKSYILKALKNFFLDSYGVFMGNLGSLTKTGQVKLNVGLEFIGRSILKNLIEDQKLDYDDLLICIDALEIQFPDYRESFKNIKLVIPKFSKIKNLENTCKENLLNY